MTDPLLHTWAYKATSHQETTVLPDGCRDVILRQHPGQRPHWFVSSLDDAARRVMCIPGERFAGIRLVPGATIDKPALLDALSVEHEIGATIEDMVREHVRISRRLHEALTALATAPRVSAAARSIGVSERTLQRLVLSKTRRSPAYWRNLARARRAAMNLSRSCPLGQIASAGGFADQAHMTREFRRWFGCPPNRFRQRADLLAMASEKGYA